MYVRPQPPTFLIYLIVIGVILYSQAVVADRTVYVSGCLGLDKDTMQLVPGGPTEQTEKALENLQAVLKAADSGVDKVVKNTVFLKDLNDFGAVNEVYKKGECCSHKY